MTAFTPRSKQLPSSRELGEFPTEPYCGCGNRRNLDGSVRLDEQCRYRRRSQRTMFESAPPDASMVLSGEKASE